MEEDLGLASVLSTAKAIKHSAKKTGCELTSKKTEGVAETTVGKESRSRRKRRTIIILVVVVSVLIGFVATTSVMTVSKLKITLVNNTEDDLYFIVLVQGVSSQTISLGPDESGSLLWNLTAWHYRYDVHHFPTSMVEVEFEVSWTDIIVFPFSEKAITYGAGIDVGKWNRS